MKINVRSWAAIALVSAALGAAAVLGVDALGLFTKDVRESPSSGAITPATVSPVASSVVQDLSDLYDQVRPSVVKVTATSGSSGGTGSGVVLDTQGYILTNDHVISGLSQITVKLSDGTNVSAVVVGTDPGDDLAILKIATPPEKLKPVKLGDPDEVRIGQPIVAIGNPLDLEATLTAGVISGLGRVLNDRNGRPLRQLIQADAAINPGNSGGGLFDLAGELIGITNALENPAGENAFAGIGYAIPLSTVQHFLPAMLAGKAISHPKLAGALEDLNPFIASSLGTDVQQGVVVAQVAANSGASRVGLRRGDVIIAIDGREVKDYNDLGAYLDTKSAGDKVEVGIIRGSSEQTVSVTLDTWVHS